MRAPGAGNAPINAPAGGGDAGGDMLRPTLTTTASSAAGPDVSDLRKGATLSRGDSSIVSPDRYDPCPPLRPLITVGSGGTAGDAGAGCGCGSGSAGGAADGSAATGTGYMRSTASRLLSTAANDLLSYR